MQSFDQFLALLGEVPDPRRAEGKIYKLPYVLLFSILAVVTGGNSFRSIETFIKVHRRRLNTAFGLRWQRAPAHTAIRYILQGLDTQAVERVFRRHAAGLRDAATDPARRSIALDGRRFGEVSTTSTTARPPNCCTHSTSKPAWSWPMSISKKSPTKSRPHSSYSANSRSRTASSRSTPCTVKKNLRGCRTGTGSPDRSTEGQSANSAAKCPSRLRFPPARQQRHHRHLRARPA